MQIYIYCRPFIDSRFQWCFIGWYAASLSNGSHVTPIILVNLGRLLKTIAPRKRISWFLKLSLLPSTSGKQNPDLEDQLGVSFPGKALEDANRDVDDDADDDDSHGEDPPGRPGGRFCCRFFSKRCCCALPQGWAKAGNISIFPIYNCLQDLRDEDQDGDDDDDGNNEDDGGDDDDDALH